MTINEAKEKLLNTARAEVGYHEQGNNITKYATAYDFDTRLYGFDMNGSPYCDYFVDWCFMKSFGFDLGSAMTYQFSGCSGAACASSASYYQSNHAWYTEPEVGDQIFFYVSGGINHTGIVEEISGGYVTTIEGNSSDQVKRNQYRIGHTTIAGYGRPLWKAVHSLESTQNGDNATKTGDTVVSGDNQTSYTLADKVALYRLKNGSIGVLVSALQAFLNHYGATLDIDGEFGILTETALVSYQETHKDADGNALEADGICGEKTWRSFI